MDNPLQPCLKIFFQNIGASYRGIFKSVLISVISILKIEQLKLIISNAQFILRDAENAIIQATIEPVFNAAQQQMKRIESIFTLGTNCSQVSDLIESFKTTIEASVKPVFDLKDKISKDNTASQNAKAKETAITNQITLVNKVIDYINSLS